MSRKKRKGKLLDKWKIINNELYKTLCETIPKLLQDSLIEPGITEAEIKAAREFTELKPNTKAARELLGFLESKEAKEVLMTYYSS